MDDRFFADLQMLNTMSEENTIVKSRKVLNDIVAWFKQREDYLPYCKIFAEDVRNLELQTLLDADGFFVSEDVFPVDIPEEFQHDSYGFCANGYVRYSGRFVYPVKDVKGDVMGFCGYDKFSDAKYLDSRNFGYIAKDYSVWGMERLPEYYKSTEPVYFMEGIVCALYLRQCGMQSLATLGANHTAYVLEIMRRFGNRAIYIADIDEAGYKSKKRLNRLVPQMRVVQSRIAKDVDDSRKVNPAFADELRKLSNRFYVSPLFK